MFTLWVIDPVLTSVTRLMSLEVVRIVNTVPTSAVLVASVISCRTAGAPAESNRYGGE